MRTRKTVVILVSGKAGSGKGEVAKFLINKLTNFPGLATFGYSFAGPIKYIAKAFFGWDGNKDKKGRKLLQDIGRVGREYDEDIWVKHFINQLDKKAGILPFDFAVIDDWRFPNELNYIRSNPILSVITIRVFGRGGLQDETASDVSENSLVDVSTEHLEMPLWLEGERESVEIYYDYQIENKDDLEQLEKKVDTILSSISKQYIVE